MPRLSMCLLPLLALFIACSTENTAVPNATEEETDAADTRTEQSTFDPYTPAVYTVAESSAIVTAFFTDDGQGKGRFFQLRRGDVLRYTGRMVTFPKGASGFEFTVVGISKRNDAASTSAPAMNENCYLLLKEINDYLIYVSADQDPGVQ